MVQYVAIENNGPRKLLIRSRNVVIPCYESRKSHSQWRNFIRARAKNRLANCHS